MGQGQEALLSTITHPLASEALVCGALFCGASLLCSGSALWCSALLVVQLFLDKQGLARFIIFEMTSLPFAPITAG